MIEPLLLLVNKVLVSKRKHVQIQASFLIFIVRYVTFYHKNVKANFLHKE